jgi:hypothetical protein
MPFFDDADGNNPLDYVLQIHSTKETEKKEGKLGSFNKNLAEDLFKNYKNQEFMSFGRSIARAIPEAIQKDVQSVAEFMNARLLNSDLLWPTVFMQNTLKQGASSANKLYTQI